MAMKTPGGRDDRKDLTRSEADVDGSQATPGTDASARDPKDVRDAGPHGGLAPNGEGMTSREKPHTKIATGKRSGDTTGEGNWSGRDGMRGPLDTSAGARSSGGSANQILGNDKKKDERR